MSIVVGTFPSPQESTMDTATGIPGLKKWHHGFCFSVGQEMLFLWGISCFHYYRFSTATMQVNEWLYFPASDVSRSVIRCDSRWFVPILPVLSVLCSFNFYRSFKPLPSQWLLSIYNDQQLFFGLFVSNKIINANKSSQFKARVNGEVIILCHNDSWQKMS